MKKIWKIRKNSEAVSPVIATILMVAITVVLAAVLYVMVMGFGGSNAQTPTGAFTGTPVNVAGTYKMTFGVVSPETGFADCKVVLSVNGTAATSQAIVLGAANTFGANSIAWTDLGSDGKISVGDSLVLSGTLTHDTTYLVTIIYGATGGQICAQSVTVP